MNRFSLLHSNIITLQSKMKIKKMKMKIKPKKKNNLHVVWDQNWPARERTVVHTGRSIIHSVFKDEGNSTSTIFFLVVYVCCCFKSSSEGFVSENHILNVNFVKETQVINSGSADHRVKVWEQIINKFPICACLNGKFEAALSHSSHV